MDISQVAITLYYRHSSISDKLVYVDITTIIGNAAACVVVSKRKVTLLANSKSLSFSTLIFGPAQERLDGELKFKRWGHREGVL